MKRRSFVGTALAGAGLSGTSVKSARAKTASETGRKPFGSGPYRLDSWESNQRLRLLRRDGDAGGFREVVFRVIPSNATWFQAGARGELDEFRVSRDQMKTAQASPDFMRRHRLLKVPQFLVAMVVWNCRHPFLADARVRRALALAWPRAEAALRLYPPEGATLASGPFPPSAPENAAAASGYFPSARSAWALSRSASA